MKTINVDFAQPYIAEELCRQGEHNETQLIFTLPDDFSGADYVNAEFQRSDGTKAVIEELHPAEDGTMTVQMIQDVTSCYGFISIQLVAYKLVGDEVNIIAKTPIIEGSVGQSIGATEPAAKDASFIERLQAWLQDARDKLTALWELRHGHSNKATIDELHSAALETPEPEVTVGGMADPYREQLAFRGQYLRMINDGGVIQGAEEVTVSGRKYLRLKIFYDPAVETYDIIEIGQNARPRFIDIPIESSQDSTIIDGGVTLNGTEINLGFDSVEQEIIGIQEDVAANTAARHSHSNQPLLNQLDVAYAFGGSNPVAVSHNGIPLDGLTAASFSGADVSIELYANCLYSHALSYNNQTGEPVYLESLEITGFQNPARIRVPEYLIEFTTGATAPTLTLPASVEWADEPTIEPNKRYQISILNNLALWCAADVEVS